MSNIAITKRLAKLGLRQAAEAYKEEIRARLKAAGEIKANANSEAWRQTWEEFRPICEQLEANQAKAAASIQAAKDAAQEAAAAPEPPPQLAGLPSDTEALLDPSYNEKDRGKQLRDGYVWAAMEFFRVIRDTDYGPLANLGAASAPPPNAYALFVLSTYALSPIDKRRDLISRALAFAEKGHEAAEEEGEEESGFMEGIG